MDSRIIFIGNCDAQGSARPIGVYAEKARFRSYRWLNCADNPEDIVLIHSSLPKDYERFRSLHFGYCPKIFYPSNDPEPLDLAKSVLTDKVLLNKLKGIIDINSQNRYTLVASVNTEEVFKIGEKLRLPVAEPGIEQINSGLWKNLNNKINFTKQFSNYGYETPNGIVVRNKKEVLKAVEIMFHKFGNVMIRKPCEASDKGNLPLVNLTEEEILNKVKQLGSDWYKDPILVEPHLDLVDSPCTAGKINKDRSVELLHTGTQVFTNSAYCWISPPDYPHLVIDEIERKFKHYMKDIAKQGAVGWVDIDWGKTSDGRLVGIESNYRMTGWTPAASLMKRMFPLGKKEYPILFDCDALPMRNKYTLEFVYDRLTELNMAYDTNKKKGVMLHCPVKDNWCGLLILSSSFDEIKEILGKLNWLTDEFDKCKEPQ